MNETTSIYGWFIASVAASTLLGTLVSMAFNSNSLPFSSKVGVALGGGAVGTLGGALLGLSLDLHGWHNIAVIFIAAIVVSVCFQRYISSWFKGL